jgi:hypothetical protein
MNNPTDELMRKMRAAPFFRRILQLADECVKLGVSLPSALHFAHAVERSVVRYRRRLEWSYEPRLEVLAHRARRSAKKALGLLTRKTFRRVEFNNAVRQLVDLLNSIAKLDPLGEWGTCVRFGLDNNIVRWVTGRKPDCWISRSQFPDTDPFDIDFDPPWIFAAARFRDLDPATYSDDGAKRGILRLLVARLGSLRKPPGPPLKEDVQILCDEICEALQNHLSMSPNKRNVKAITIFDALVEIYGLSEVIKPSYRIEANTERGRRAKRKAGAH